MFDSYLDLSNVLCRRVVWPWLGLKMLDLKPMMIPQLKEISSSFPDVRKGVLVAVVRYF
jgi:HtrA serine peptidase 2